MNEKVILVMLAVITLMGCKSKSQNGSKASQYESDSIKIYKPAKNIKSVLNYDSLAHIDAYEKNNPTKFLKLTSDYIKNPQGQWLIKGIVKCTATMSEYYYLNLKLVYYQNHSRVLGEGKFTLKEVFSSNTIKDFEFISDTFPDADSIAVSIEKASVHL